MAKKFQNFAERIEEKYGEDIINIDEDFSQIESVKVIPTSSLALNCSIGVGGIPLGRITTIYGPESSAKTSLALDITKNAVALGYNVLYVDVEQGLDHNYIKAMVGDIDTTRLLTPQPETAEQALYICEEGINSKEFNVIILDSIGGLAPEKEKEDEYGKAHIALIPRVLSQFLRRNGFAIRSNNIAFIFINQVRASIGSFVGGFDMPGGYALKHWSSLIIQLYKADQIDTGSTKETKNIIGILSRFNIKKNKLSSPFKSFTFPLIFGVGIDYVADTLDFAEFLEVISKKGSYYTFEGKTLAQGRFNTIEFLRNNKETLDKIVDNVYNIVKVKSKKLEERSEVDNTDITAEENI